ncbi:hypothetical protein LBMAG27_22030 [Bacteroidota bacterium]|nr:hypothetical protein LBMAG27_22030 [Bacteroidota bacterium]
MRKNILTALVLSSAIFVFSSASAQQTTGTKTTTPNTNMQKGTTTVVPGSTVSTTKQTSAGDQSNMAAKELGSKITEWMKMNVGIDAVQTERINVASTNLLTKVRDIRTNVTDPQTRNTQIHFAMQTYESQLKSVMKPEQFEIYKSKRHDLLNSYKEMKDETINETE